jgi:hypothetical protein
MENIEMNKIIYNAIRTPDGTIMESKNRHDYQTYMDKNGHEYMVDGGLDYLRRNVIDTAPYEELSVYEDDPHILKREVIKWGTYGINGDEPLRYVKLMEMNDGHIQACLDTQTRMKPSYRVAFIDELNFRKEVL